MIKSSITFNIKYIFGVKTMTYMTRLRCTKYSHWQNSWCSFHGPTNHFCIIESEDSGQSGPGKSLEPWLSWLDNDIFDGILILRIRYRTIIFVIGHIIIPVLILLLQYKMNESYFRLYITLILYLNVKVFLFGCLNVYPTITFRLLNRFLMYFGIQANMS